MTWSGLDRTQESCKAEEGVCGKQVLQGKLGVDGLFIHCLRISQFLSLLMALPFFCVLIQEEFCCQKLKGGCRN